MRRLTLTTSRIRLVLRDSDESPVAAGTEVTYPARAADVAREIAASLTADEPTEVLLAILLDARHRVIGFTEVCRGTTNKTSFTPADVLRPVIMSGAVSFILTHNHPSGDPAPSRADRMATTSLRTMAQGLGVPMTDHIIIGDHDHYSMRDLDRWES